MVTTGEQQGGACVARIVEPDVRQTRPLEERLERGRCEVAEVQRLATVGAKDQTVILPHSSESEPLGVLGSLVDPKRLDGLPGEPHAATLTVLGRCADRAGPRLGLGPPDPKDIGLLVQVFPFETQKLAHTQPRRDGEYVEASRRSPLAACRN